MYRILIADDEAIECKALRYKLESHFSIFEILPSVSNGVELLKSAERNQPDIMIIDINMAGLNGLEALEILKMKQHKAKIIIHTAYSRFTYAKKAIELGADGYVLKPDTEEEMIEVLTRLSKELEEEDKSKQVRQDVREEVDSLRNMAARKWLSSLYRGEPDEECYQIFEKNCSALKEGGFLTVWQVSAEECIQQIIDSMKELCSCVEFIHKEELMLLILPGYEEGFQRWFQEIFECVKQELEKKNLSASVGVSQFKKADDEFVMGIYEARTIVQDAEQGQVSFFYYGSHKQQKFLNESSIQLAAQALEKGKIEECMLLAKDFLYGTEEWEEKKARAFVYLFELKEALSFRDGLDLEREWKLWGNFRNLRMVEELTQWLLEGMELCSQSLTENQKGTNIYIQKTYLFLEENLGGDISLEDVSGAVGISYFYLSRLLKQEKNTNFRDMLGNIRIWRAIKLMQNQEKPIGEISREVGYVNVTYFYKVFKKMTGITVGEIRKLL